MRSGGSELLDILSNVIWYLFYYIIGPFLIALPLFLWWGIVDKYDLGITGTILYYSGMYIVIGFIYFVVAKVIKRMRS